jgi:hypothetical protein
MTIRALTVLATLSITLATASLSSAAGGRVDAARAIVGHDDLEGVRETGSELRSREGDRFEWFTAYGGMDQSSSGRWTREHERVAWIDDAIGPGGNWFSLDHVFLWDAKVERRLLQSEYDRRRAQAEASCPFLGADESTMPETAAPPMPDVSGKYGAEIAPQSPGELSPLDAASAAYQAAASNASIARRRVDDAPQDIAAQRRAVAAEAAAQEALDRYTAALKTEAARRLGLLDRIETDYEAAAAVAMRAEAAARESPLDPQLRGDADREMGAARTLNSLYELMRYTTVEIHRTAGVPMPQRAPPDLPPPCRLPHPPGDADARAAQSGQGMGVVIGDPEAGLRFSGICVEFQFDDGHREQRVTNRGGWALLRPRIGAKLRRVKLRNSAEDVQAGRLAVEETIDLDPMKGDVFVIRLDRMMPPAFEGVELQIDDDGFVPTWPRGGERGCDARQ